MAQEIATKRFWKLVDEQTWNNHVKNLQIYCENDVRAMIAVEKFAKAILSDKYKI
jgi:hypothetical protein